MALTELSASELLAGLEKQQFSAREIAEELLQQSQKMAHLGGLAHLDPALFYQQADQSDARRARGQALALDGVPLVLKDNLNTTDMPTTSSTGALQGRFPLQDAQIVSQLRQAGAVLPAKAVMHELAFGITTNNATTGPSRNPYDPNRIPGGSSGGTATAVAARQFPAGLGTDTGASVRLPASLCGLYGFRPTVGRYSGQGIVPLSPTRDTAGPMTRSLADISLLDSVLCQKAPSLIATPSLKELRLGVPRDSFWKNLDAGVAKVALAFLDDLQKAGVTLVEVDLSPLLARNARVGMPIVLYETLQTLPLYLAENKYGIGLDELIAGINSPDVKEIFDAITGDYTISQEAYEEALNLDRPLMQQAYTDLLRSSDISGLIFPTTPLTACPIGDDETTLLNGKAVPTFNTYISRTDLGSNLGAPGISLPVGLSAGLPVGILVEADIGADDHLLALCRAIDPLLPATPAPDLSAGASTV
ncbi:indoleacetamide hydrolase [Alcaligenes faecalis]|nr:indoleacetamide hydrolase [Alcaligenes faecalis]